jgi:DNA-binding PadR family transcriptional regulator
MNVRTLCLGVLSFADATGYQIKKTVEDGMFNHFIEASYGSIYPALTRMSEEGLVTCREEAQSGRPDKKVYSITPKGRSELVAALSGPPHEDKFKSEFLFVMLMSEILPPAHIARVYERRIADLKTELQGIRECAKSGAHPGGRFVAGYGAAIVEAAIAYLEANRPQVSENAERTGSGSIPAIAE